MGQGGENGGAAPTSQQPSAGARYGTEAAYAASALTSAYAGLKAAQAEKSAQDWNARVADLQATNAVNKGVYDANQVRARSRRLIGAMRVGYAGQNVQVDSGVAADTVDQAANTTEADATQIKANAYLEAWGFKVDAAQSRLKGAQAETRAASEAIGGFLSAGAKIGEYQDRMSR